MGEVVILRDANPLVPRIKWRMGIVRELLPSQSDGKIRNVMVQVASGRLLKRSIQSLVILDIDRQKNVDECGLASGEDS